MHKLIKLILIKNAVTKREINKFAFNFSKKLIQPAYYRLPTKVCSLMKHIHKAQKPSADLLMAHVKMSVFQ